MTTKNVFVLRRWLNKTKRNRAFIIATIDHEESKAVRRVSREWVETGKITRQVSAALELGDCARAITLDFDGWTKKERVQHMQKLNDLIADLEKFRAALEEAYAWADDNIS